MLFVEPIEGFAKQGRRVVALPGAFRSRFDLMHHASSVAAILQESEQPVREILLTEFRFGTGDRGSWHVLAEQVAEVLRPGDVLFADSLGGALAALLPEEVRGGISVLLRRPPLVGSLRMVPEGPVQKIYASWLRRIAGCEYDRVVQSILPEIPDYPGGFGVAPEPAVLSQIIPDFGASNVELLGSSPKNWFIVKGGQDQSFHPTEALGIWQNWGMKVFDNLPSAVSALQLD